MRLLCLAVPVLAFAAGELSNRRAPGFALPDQSIVRQHDLADYRGRVVLLDVMRTSCPSCQALTRTLERVKAKYGDRLSVLSIVVPPDTQSTVANYTLFNKVTTPILFDCGQVAASYLKVTPNAPTIHLPHLFLIDQHGAIRNDWGVSESSKRIFEGDGLFAEVDRLLAPPAPPQPKKR